MVADSDARDLAFLPVDELALWVLRAMVASKHATFQRSHFIERLLRDEGERLPGDSAYRRRDATSSEPPHLGRALAEAWGWLLSEGLLAEAARALVKGRFPLDGYAFVTRFG